MVLTALVIIQVASSKTSSQLTKEFHQDGYVTSHVGVCSWNPFRQRLHATQLLQVAHTGAICGHPTVTDATGASGMIFLFYIVILHPKLQKYILHYIFIGTKQLPAVPVLSVSLLLCHYAYAISLSASAK